MGQVALRAVPQQLPESLTDSLVTACVLSIVNRWLENYLYLAPLSGGCRGACFHSTSSLWLMAASGLVTQTPAPSHGPYLLTEGTRAVSHVGTAGIPSAYRVGNATPFWHVPCYLVSPACLPVGHFPMATLLCVCETI